MTRRGTVAAMIGLAAAVLAAAVLPRTSAADARPERAKPLVVMIGHSDCAGVIGAGIVVGVLSDRLYIATADHVVRCKGRRLDNTVEVRFHFLPGERVAAKVLDTLDRGLDLTVLSVVGVRQHAIPVDDIPFGLLGDPEVLAPDDEVFMTYMGTCRAGRGLYERQLQRRAVGRVCVVERGMFLARYSGRYLDQHCEASPLGAPRQARYRGPQQIRGHPRCQDPLDPESLNPYLLWAQGAGLWSICR